MPLAYTYRVVQPSGPKLVAGKYELVRLVAEGGMGAVYECRNTATLKRCAIKLLTVPGIDQHPDVVQRFFLEARASSILESDHIVHTFDSGVDNDTGRPYIIMEFLRGEDLKATLQRTGPLEPRAAAKLILQAATGLAKAHDSGILHRDIKPANLFLSSRDSGHVCVKLLDFGIAKVRADDPLAQQGLTQTGSLLGTPLYMSPEQVRGASSVDASSDVWSLGVVLFECLTCDMPFQERGSMGELMSSILNADPRHLQDVAPWVPPGLAAIVARALARDRAHRFAHAGQLRDAIGQLLLGDTELREVDVVGVSASDRTQVSPRLVVLQPSPPSPHRTARGPAGADRVEILTPELPAPEAQRVEILTPELPAPEVDTPLVRVPARSPDAITIPAASIAPVSLRQEDQTQLSGSGPVVGSTSPSPSTADRSRLGRALALSAALLAVALALVFTLQPNQAAPTPSAQPSALPPPRAAAAAPTIVPSASVLVAPVETRSFALPVPKGCRAALDGAPAKISNGSVRIEGAVGSEHVVKLSGCRARHELTTVTVTASGLNPASIDAEPAKRFTAPPAALAARIDEKPAPPASAAPPPSALPQGIKTSTDEFGGVTPR